MFKILHFSKGGWFDSEWLDLSRNTIMKNRFFQERNLKKFWVLRNFSVDSKWLDLPRITVMENTFFHKQHGKILGDEIFLNFFLREVQSSWNELICLEHCHEKHYFQKNFECWEIFPRHNQTKWDCVFTFKMLGLSAALFQDASCNTHLYIGVLWSFRQKRSYSKL